MYYRYNSASYELIEKSPTKLTGKNVVISQDDINITLFKVTAVHIDDAGVMHRYDMMIRDAFLIAARLKEVQDENNILREELKAADKKTLLALNASTELYELLLSLLGGGM